MSVATTRPALGRKRRVTPGTLVDLQRECWHALRIAASLLDDADPVLRLKSVHAFSAVAGQYRAVWEAADLQGRVEALEAKQLGRAA